jgi:glucose-6-phosphate-specific signal transduction histidine kinase
MIQRIQTVYLLLASICLALIYFFSLWGCVINIEGNHIIYQLKIEAHLPLLLSLAIAFTITILSIFYFKNRKKQIWFCLAAIFTVIAFLALCNFYVADAKKSYELVSSAYSLAVLLPFATLVFIAFAIWNIRKDERLIKSLDRLR